MRSYAKIKELSFRVMKVSIVTLIEEMQAVVLGNCYFEHGENYCSLRLSVISIPKISIAMMLAEDILNKTPYSEYGTVNSDLDGRIAAGILGSN